jgi:hypothetical protein
LPLQGAPRTAFAVIEDPEDADHRLFLHAKNNLATPPQGLGFRLEQTIVVEGIVASRVIWDTEPVTITANQALAAEAAGPDQRTAKDEAEEFLRDILADGPVPAKDVQEAARNHLISTATLRRAKATLKINIERDGFGPGSTVSWSIGAQNSIDAQHKNMSTYGENEHLWRNDGTAADPCNPSVDAQQTSMDPEGIYGGQAPAPEPDHPDDLDDADDPEKSSATTNDDLDIPAFLRRSS